MDDYAVFTENWEIKLAALSLIIGVLSVLWLFRAPKAADAGKAAKNAKAKAKNSQPQTADAPVPTAAVPAPAPAALQGKSIASLMKSQGKRKGPAVPTHALFGRLFKSSGNADVTCFAVSPDGRVSVAVILGTLGYVAD